VPGGNGANIYLTPQGTQFGDVIAVKDGGKLLVCTDTALTANGTGLEADCNVTTTGAFGVKSPSFDIFDINSTLDSSQMNTLTLLNEKDEISDTALFENEYDYIPVYDEDCTKQQIDDGKCPTHLERTTWFSTIAIKDRTTIIQLNQETKSLWDRITELFSWKEIKDSKDTEQDIIIQSLNSTIELWKPRWDELCLRDNTYSWC